jgi:hypothetical protein
VDRNCGHPLVIGKRSAGKPAERQNLQNKAIRGNMSNIKAASDIASRPPMTGLVARGPPAQNKAKKPNDFSQRM